MFGDFNAEKKTIFFYIFSSKEQYPQPHVVQLQHTGFVRFY